MPISQESYNHLIDLFCHARIAKAIAEELLSPFSLLTDSTKLALVCDVADRLKREYEATLSTLYTGSHIPSIYIESYNESGKCSNRNTSDNGGMFYATLRQTLELQCTVMISNLEDQLNTDFSNPEYPKLQYTGYYYWQNSWIQYKVRLEIESYGRFGILLNSMAEPRTAVIAMLLLLMGIICAVSGLSVGVGLGLCISATIVGGLYASQCFFKIQEKETVSYPENIHRDLLPTF